MNQSFVEGIERRLSRWCGRGVGRTWVVAVSGGSDSVGLLRVLNQLAGTVGLTLSVAHLDHGARGDVSRQDAAFVSELAGALGLPFDLGNWRPIRAGHFEADARRARYVWLTEIARARGASAVAVGHTHDDQAETILYRILRGTGPRGLAGMRAIRRLGSVPELFVARPLLAVTRREIRDYLAALRQPYREDASNFDLARTRARIRHDLLPKLAGEYNPEVARAIVRLGLLSRSLERALESELQRHVRETVLTCDPTRILLKKSFVRGLSPFLRSEVIRRIWRRAGWPEASMSAERWERLAALLRRNEISPIQVGGGIEVWTDKSLLILRRIEHREAAAPESVTVLAIPLFVPGRTGVEWAAGTIELCVDPPPDTECDERIDLGQLALPLVVRRPAAGDRFDPLGLHGNTQALADFFRGRHVPRDRRASIPLVCDQTGIVWVVGHRISDRVKHTQETGRVLGLKWMSVV